MSIGLFQILVIALVVLVLVGPAGIAALTREVGKGMRRFREGLGGEEILPLATHADSSQPEHAADADRAPG